MIEGKDREETIRLTAEGLGISTAQARFMYAIAHRESYGDVEILDDDGRPMPLASQDEGESDGRPGH